MRIRMGLVTIILTLAASALFGADAALAQSRGGGTHSFSERLPVPTRGNDGGHGSPGGRQPGGHRHGGGIIIGPPPLIGSLPPPVSVEDGGNQQAKKRRHARVHAPRRTRRRLSGMPPAGETRFVPDEIVVSLRNNLNASRADALQRRYRLQRLESYRSQLAGVTLYRWRIPDRRSVGSVIRTLEQNRLIGAAQPNYIFTLQQNGNAAEGDPAQYELSKLHLLQAHKLATGDNVKIAVIDSAIDQQSPELNGSIAATLDTLKTPMKPHAHGTAVAGLIAAHGRLMGSAPGAKLLAVRAFDPNGASARGTTFNILKGLDWAAANGARIINMSFAGPADPAIHRALAAAYKKDIVLIAAAGNGGPTSPPLYPAADAHVIAVTATDAADKLFAQSNRGKQIALAAPGANILVIAPNGAVALSSGTSYSAAEVSGIAALLLQRRHGLPPDQVRRILMHTAKDLGRKGRDVEFGAGLVNAYAALMAERVPVTAATPLPTKKTSAGARE